MVERLTDEQLADRYRCAFSDCALAVRELQIWRALIPEVIESMERLDNWALIPIIAKLREAIK